MIREEFDYHHGDIFSLIVGAADNADRMRKRLREILVDRSSHEAAAIIVPRSKAQELIKSSEAMAYGLADAAEALSFIERETSEGRAALNEGGIRGVLSLCAIGMDHLANHEGECLLRFNNLIRASLRQDEGEIA